MEVGETRRLEEERRTKEQAYEMRKKILTWLSPDDFEGTHQGHFKKRFENTGQWLLNDLRFRDWKDGTKSSLLWCHGARKSYIYFMLIYALILTYTLAGSGKTVLAYGHYKLVIDNYS